MDIMPEFLTYVGYQTGKDFMYQNMIYKINATGSLGR